MWTARLHKKDNVSSKIIPIYYKRFSIGCMGVDIVGRCHLTLVQGRDTRLSIEDSCIHVCPVYTTVIEVLASSSNIVHYLRLVLEDIVLHKSQSHGYDAAAEPKEHNSNRYKNI